jgi:2-isopropylmalate synthase
MARTIRIFDTTLRDGEQAPGCSMNLEEKLQVARGLELLGVDVMEAGFAIASPGDFESVQAIARTIKKVGVASLARAVPGDIERAWEAIRDAARPRIHTFIATSPIHMEYKLKMSGDQVLEQARTMTALARKLCPDVEFSAEDASRSDPDFLCRVFEAVIAAGATTINVPDTVGYAQPEEFGALIKNIMNRVPNIDKAVVSVHCHNDLGLAVANSLAAVREGAGQVECTINGLGERAGNASLEEVVMNLRTRADSFGGAECGVDATKIYPASRLVIGVTGVNVQPNKAIVGQNAFAHEAGIHQHGMLANRATYEIMTPQSIGLPENRMVLGKHSGKHAFEDRLKELGFNMDKEELSALFDKFKLLADRKKVVSDRDIEALAVGAETQAPEYFKLDRFVITSGNTIANTSTVRLMKNDGQTHERVSIGDGPIDASFCAIDKIIGFEPKLESFSLSAVTGGTDAQGEANVKISRDGRFFNGHGLSTDIVESTVIAYVNAINAALWEAEKKEKASHG